MTESEAIKWQKQMGEVFKGFHLDIEEKMNISCDMAINALEKQIPKKPKERDCIGFNTLVCPVCKEELYLYEPYCDNCGQAIDWSDEE